jgi:acetate kinase
MAAIHHGMPIDTTMSFTPTSGLVMGTRPGDMDPGLLVYLMQEGKRSTAEMDKFISDECGLRGISQTSSDMRDLLQRRPTDPRAADAVDLFCYQARKFIGAFFAALGGLDTLVFSGGIGEHAPEIRAGICHRLDCMGIDIDPARNAAGNQIISTDASRVTVRVIPTDEEAVIADAVQGFVQNQPATL